MPEILNIINKKMTRKEFLEYTGLFLLTITGIIGIVQSILNLNTVKKNSNTQSFGYGVYGGKKKELI